MRHMHGIGHRAFCDIYARLRLNVKHTYLLISLGLLILSGCAPLPSTTVEAIKTETVNLPLVVVEGGEHTSTETVLAGESFEERSTLTASGDIPQAEETKTASMSDREGGDAMSNYSGEILADVISVEVSGNEGAYKFTVGINSPDTGCNQYADWWEVISEDGVLIYRRILLHSHVDEQPFIRSGGAVAISPDSIVWVRAHMHPGGYGGAAFRGSVQAGFSIAELAPDYAAELAENAPLPDGCAF